MAGLIPERLVTIRRYASTGPAVDDCRLLVDAGFDAYIRTYRWQDIGEVRVPESQVQEALALLPALDASDAVEEVERCPWCGSHDARLVAPLTTVLMAGAAAWIGWELYARRFEGAAAAALLSLLAVALTKMATGRLICVNCGRDWRMPKPAAGMDPEE